MGSLSMELNMGTVRMALLTGACGGLAGALLERLVARGWRVFAADFNEGGLKSFAGCTQVVPIRIDVTDSASVKAAFAEVATQTDRLDAIVNFAGVLGVGSLVEMSEERLQRVIDVNVMGTFRINKTFFGLLHKGRGRIVNISSETGWQSAAPFNGPYAMSKHAIEAYSDALRRELALLGIAVIKIQPGPFKTAMADGIERAFEVARDESTHFSDALDGLIKLVGKHAGTMHAPDVLAEVIEEALTTKHPKAVYSVRPDLARALLDKLPRAASDRVWLAILRKAAKG